MKDPRLVTLKLTNNSWYSSIERAYVTFTSPKGKSINIKKSYWRWGLDCFDRLRDIIQGDTKRIDFDVEVTLEEMSLLFKMSKIESFADARVLEKELIALNQQK